MYNEGKLRECGKSFSQDSAYSLHRRVHGEKPHECRECGKHFIRSTHLKEHERSHTGEKPYKCIECGKCFSRSTNLMAHKKVHTGEKPYKCKQCQKCFTGKTALLYHRRVHTQEKPYKCGECHKYFTGNAALLNHTKIHEKTLKCEGTTSDTRQGSGVKRPAGRKVHNKESKKCEECGKCFTRNSYLKEHRRTHTGEKPYKCKECEKAFSRSSNLIMHKKVHTGEKSYKCEECNKHFSGFSALAYHKRIHTGEKPYKCEDCKKCFSTFGYLNTHKRIHTGEKPYKCEDCDKYFAQSGNLRLHRKVHVGKKTGNHLKYHTKKRDSKRKYSAEIKTEVSDDEMLNLNGEAQVMELSCVKTENKVDPKLNVEIPSDKTWSMNELVNEESVGKSDLKIEIKVETSNDELNLDNEEVVKLGLENMESHRSLHSELNIKEESAFSDVKNDEIT